MATLDLPRRTAVGPSRAHTGAAASSLPDTAPKVDVVVPVYNEAASLELSVRCLDAFLEQEFPLTARITIVDNASTDGTCEIAQRLSRQLRRVQAIHLDEKGRGRALRAAWSTSDAAILAYMDVDLSTDLGALLPLVTPLLRGASDITIGSRLLPGSRVRRGRKRELISRGYNALLRTALHTGFRDAQCGFKALRADAAQRLLDRVEDQGWFFDTELLVLAERLGMSITEVPVDWNEDPDSRVDILTTALTDLRGIVRLRRTLGRRARVRARGGTASLPFAVSPGRLVRFVGIGLLSTIGYAFLYALLRTHLAAAPSNTVALLATAVANTEANRRFTFGVRASTGRVWHHMGGLAAFGVALATTTLAVAALGLADPGAPRPLELTVLVAASGVATLARFIMLGRVVAGRPLS
ncbi:MAG TPA: bifunctional glycosyltransferase family 2/GtrA family protein [Candidatus Dormibacteraeota bacterium]